MSAQVAEAISAQGVHVERVAGATRYETSRAVAERSVGAGMDPAATWLSSGGTWPDALSAGPAVAAAGGVLLLVDGADLDHSPPAQTWLTTYADEIQQVTVVGGPDVLRPGLVVQVERALDSAQGASPRRAPAGRRSP